MPSAGELLRNEREKRGRSLAEVAEQTRITRKYLDALEVDDVKSLPGEFFYKAFIRQYALALELDEATTARILNAAIPMNEPDPLPVLKEVYEKAQNGASTRWRPSTAVAIGALLLVLAGGSALYALWQRYQTQSEAGTATVLHPSTSPQATTESPGPAPQPQPQAAEPVAAPAPTTAAAPEPAAETPTTPIVEISSTEPAWIQLSSEGKAVFTGIIDPSQPRQFEIATTAKLLTGNAGGLEIRYNGKPVGPIGPKGQVRTVLFGPEGAQVAGAKPKAAAPDNAAQQ